MKPKQHTRRNGLDVADVSDTPEDVFLDSFLEDDEESFLDNMDSIEDVQELRIESLKRAIDIAKLMSNVTTEDVINIAATVFDYIKNTKI